jgi:hypothetical protein
MKKVNLKDSGILKTNRTNGSGPISSLRIKILIMFLVVLIILMVYHTYLEEPTDSDHKNKIHDLSNISSIDILNDLDNKNITTQLFNPSVTIIPDGQYFIVFEKNDINGTFRICISNSNDGISWSSPKILFKDINYTRYPTIHYFQDQYLILSFEINGTRHISLSENGIEWTPPERSEHYDKNDLIYYAKNYFILANQSGVWYINYKEIDIEEDSRMSEQLLAGDHSNASILYLNEQTFIVVNENSTDGYSSIIITTLFFQESSNKDSEIKWDLLIIFVILGFILLVIIVQEVAHD